MSLCFSWETHPYPCSSGCVDGHVGGSSDPECGPGPGRGRGHLYGDRGLPHSEVSGEMGRVEMRGER